MINKSDRQYGFTLIELLVVISIIALLLSILMPSLQRVRQQAYSVACMSNMKQMGLGMMTYTMDNDDRYPVGDQDGDWQTTRFDNVFFLIFDYVNQSRDVFLCPSHKGPKNPNMNNERSYFINTTEREPWDVPFWKSGLHSRKSSNIKNGSSIAAIFDIHFGFSDYNLPLFKVESTGWNIWYNQNAIYDSLYMPPGSYKVDLIADTAPHSSGKNYKANITFADGHADKEPYIKDETGRNDFPILPKSLFYFD